MLENGQISHTCAMVLLMINEVLIPQLKAGYQEYTEHAVRSGSKSLLHHNYPILNGYAYLDYWEQNPNTSSKWAKLANEGHKVVQVFWDNKYKAVFVDGEVELYE
jgi:hypothetical protein